MLSNFKGALYYASLDRSLLKNYRHSKKAPLTIEIRVEIEIKTNEKNRTVTIGRDIMGRVIKETSPSGREVGYVWGGSGCLGCSGDDLKLTVVLFSPGTFSL
jgi:hypothetical protein